MCVVQLCDRRGDWEADKDLGVGAPGGPGVSEPIREGEGVEIETSLGLPDLANKNAKCPVKVEFQISIMNDFSRSISHALSGTYLY